MLCVFEHAENCEKHVHLPPYACVYQPTVILGLRGTYLGTYYFASFEARDTGNGKTTHERARCRYVSDVDYI